MKIKDWKRFRDNFIIEKYKDGITGLSIKEITIRLGIEEYLVKNILKKKHRLRLPKKKAEPKKKIGIKPKEKPMCDKRVNQSERRNLLWLILEGKNKEASELSMLMYFR